MFSAANYPDYTDSLGRKDLEARVNNEIHQHQEFIHSHLNEIGAEILGQRFSTREDWGGGWSWKVTLLDKRIDGRTIELVSWSDDTAEVRVYDWGGNYKRRPHCWIHFTPTAEARI